MAQQSGEICPEGDNGLALGERCFVREGKNLAKTVCEGMQPRGVTGSDYVYCIAGVCAARQRFAS